MGYRPDSTNEQVIHAAIKVCQAAISHDYRAKWAWLRLGRYYKVLGQEKDAITSYQSALREAPEDAQLWEELSEAYSTQGKYFAALKAMKRALEISSANGATSPTFSTSTITLWARQFQLAALHHLVEIGRAVQQECRDRSRMPSSA
eukprot:TRINITY_DN37236_c0_g1_i1.p1 TRINITY_DN37236_c0_g1~~TRINITY_DN37236_c0_g1_i1.p1  ORF type:complete len:169 (+),score=22.42 TRINITY_DN37236_c0_g1_i1:69-509(+)